MNDLRATFAADIAKYAAMATMAPRLRTLLGLDAPESYPIAAYHISATDALFRAYVVTPDRFFLFDMLADSSYLIVAMPLRQVIRLVEQSDPTTLVVTIEFDADRLVTTHVVEFASGISAIETDENPPTQGSAQGRSETFRANYVLAAPLADKDATDRLLQFSAALRGTLT